MVRISWKTMPNFVTLKSLTSSLLDTEKKSVYWNPGGLIILESDLRLMKNVSLKRKDNPQYYPSSNQETRLSEANQRMGFRKKTEKPKTYWASNNNWSGNWGASTTGGATSSRGD